MDLIQMNWLSYQIACFYPCVLLLTLATAQINTNRTYTITKGARVTKPGCPKQCGNVTVPYPFGIGSGCALNSEFAMNCSKSNDGSDKPHIGSNIVVNDISDAELRIANSISLRCYNSDGTMLNESIAPTIFLKESYGFSQLNSFTGVGSDEYATMMGSNNLGYGCHTSCMNGNDIMEGVCMGKGCCQLRHVITGLKFYNTTMSIVGNRSNVWSFSPCAYAFLGEADLFNFRGVKDVKDWNFLSRTKVLGSK